MNRLHRTIGIYGFGRAGRSLALSILRFTEFEIVVYSTRDHAPQSRITFTRDANEFFSLNQRYECDALFIAIPDDAIEKLACQMEHLSWLPQTVAHLSGVLSSTVLAPISQRTFIAQFHPLVSLDGASEIPTGSLIAISSQSEETRNQLALFALVIDCSPATLKEGTQPLYHAAAVLTGNLSLGLVSMSQKMLEQCGVESNQARIALARLLKSAAVAVEKGAVTEALTGPLARGDVQTISKHLAAFQNTTSMNDEISIYSLLARELIPQVALTENAKKEILAMFSS